MTSLSSQLASMLLREGCCGCLSWGPTRHRTMANDRPWSLAYHNGLAPAGAPTMGISEDMPLAADKGGRAASNHQMESW
jgi:hypothetical protein